jgi:hypothetical protein
MNTMSKIKVSMAEFFESIAKARMQSTLLSMGREWVERHGYSYSLLRAGVHKWPWRDVPEVAAQEKEFKQAITELKSFTDRELRELGINRNGIENAVRYGHPENDYDFEQDKFVA